MSGYFNVASEEREEIVEKEEKEAKEEWRWSRVGSRCSLMILKLAFVLFFVLLLANHHFNQSNQKFLPYTSDFPINKLH